MRINRVVVGALSLLLLFTGCSQSNRSLKVIGITQIVEHPALDYEREGFLSELSESGFIDGKNIKVLYQNAQGNLGIATQISQRFAGSNLSLAVAFSTPSAQSLAGALQGRKVPMLFSAVLDPVGAKLVRESGEPAELITGISDHLSPDSQLEMVQSFLPKIQRLGVIYNPGEPNSVKAFEELEKSAVKKGITLTPSLATKTSDVTSAALYLIGKVQAVYIPMDNTAVSSISSIVRVGVEHQLPVFAADIGSVEKGAIAMAGYDRRQLGKKLGRLAVRVLNGESPAHIPVSFKHLTQLTVNKKAAAKMRIDIPPRVAAEAVFIGN